MAKNKAKMHKWWHKGGIRNLMLGVMPPQYMAKNKAKMHKWWHNPPILGKSFFFCNI